MICSVINIQNFYVFINAYLNKYKLKNMNIRELARCFNVNPRKLWVKRSNNEGLNTGKYYYRPTCILTGFHLYDL